MADAATFFGNINAVIKESAQTAANIRTAITGVGAGSPTPFMQGAATNPPSTTSTGQTVALVGLLGAAGLVLYLLMRNP